MINNYLIKIFFLNRDCPRKDGELCSGPEHGKCNCGQCVCNSNFVGEDCSCPKSNQTCIKEGDTEVCSGRGECVCGACKCSSTDQSYYSGAYCEYLKKKLIWIFEF